MKTPILIESKSGIVSNVVIAKNEEHLEELFTQLCEDYGVIPVDENFENGYIELECNTSICMCWA